MSTKMEFLAAIEEWTKHYFFRSLTEFFNNLKNSELSLLQAYALSYIFFKGPVKITELCEYMIVSPGAASQMVDRLVKLEMVERVADSEDRRVRKVCLSEKGETFMNDNFRFSQNWMGEIPTSITSEQEAQVISTLTLLIDNFGMNTLFDQQEKR